MTNIEKIIATLADLRSVAPATILEELAANNEHTHSELHKLACAFAAVA